MNERVNAPIPNSELERRWSTIRAAMTEAGVDVLLMQANNDFMGGYVKYFTDVPATNGYPVTVIFPLDDRMTVIGQGAFDMVQEIPDGSASYRRGVARYLGTPSYAPIPYTAAYDSDLAVRALQPYAKAVIGILGK